MVVIEDGVSLALQRMREGGSVQVRAVRYYQLALWLPIALPACLGLFHNALPPESSAVETILELIEGSGLVGGIPYAILALGLTRWIRDKEPRRVRVISFVVPVAFAVILFALATAWFVITRSPLGEAATLGLTFGGFALLFGYGYAFLVEVVRLISVRLGVVEPAVAVTMA